ncbi:phage GP46 family protein [Paraburkholderia atlantica]|uniref:phage GP46 family protein n=1 Tax=Paraburkholderia atlantica TaxID=2654982 RepID=UPI00161356C8|nr:phage GP46 family protein [Paraburkholderia atlantica]MBB5414114.1 phage gp46-like protein [Paraburkholderia atlantica]
MSDTQTIWDSANSRGDWKMAGPVLATGDDLQTAILISLFTDRMAEPDDVIPDGSGDPRGWWGDAGESVPIGSRLWLLSRAKQTQETLQKAYDYIVEALQWLIDDGVVAKFDVRVEWTRASMLGAQVVAYKQDGSTSATAYTWAWQGIN